MPAPQQDRASAESELVTPQEPSTSTTEQHSISETPIHQVKPVLGMTPTENHRFQNRNQPTLRTSLEQQLTKGMYKLPSKPSMVFMLINQNIFASS